LVIAFLGTGASTGVPMLACPCKVCRSGNPKNNRLRASILVQTNGFNILVDTSTDLRRQCLSANINKIDAILFTHHHADHILGLEELRAFNFIHKISIPVYGKEETFKEIKKVFHYVFEESSNYSGTLSRIDINHINEDPFVLGGIDIVPLDIIHGNMRILGYKFGSCAYITDCSDIPENTLEHLYELDVLILNALRLDPHPTHINLEEAIGWTKRLKPKRAILTHMTHQIDYAETSLFLPENVELAYDGLRVKC
tara:strand:+ start:854 stop:1618 length:765 start_codon:yes stop_codon:yes gene_type:complete